MRLPFTVKHQNKTIELLEYEKPIKPYFVLESVTVQNLKIVHVITKNLISVGRGLENDIRVTDISVSREHAKIKWQRDGTIFFVDLMSKFGTAVQLQKPLLVTNQLFQIGRTTLKLKVEQNTSVFQWLCCMKKKQEVKYSQQQKKSYPLEFDERYDLVNQTQRELEFIKKSLNKN